MIHDVKETVDALRVKYPDHEMRAVSFEGMPFREQLKVIRETDLLIAVHGAGNVHVLFLESSALSIYCECSWYLPPIDSRWNPPESQLHHRNDIGQGHSRSARFLETID